MHSFLQATRLKLVIAFVAIILTSVEASATNGYFSHGVGTINKSLAGAGSAAPSETLITAINPAAAVYVGSKFEFGLSIFSPMRSYQTTQSEVNGQYGAFTLTSKKIDSSNKSFPIPYIGKIWAHGDHSAFALNFYGRGGMNTKYRRGSAVFDPDGNGPQPASHFAGSFGAGSAGVDLSQAFLDVTYAARSGSVNWGVSLVLAAQAFEAEGLASFAPFTETFARSSGSAPPRNLSDNGHNFSFGYGAKLGVIWEATRTLNLAASYQTETIMQRFDRYADLFADNGEFNIPANVRLGVSWRATKRTTLHFDADRTFFSDVAAIGNSASSLKDCPTAGMHGANAEACLGGSDGAGFGWEDVTTYHLGVETYIAGLTHWTWRAGYSRANSPVRSTEVLFNVLAPGVTEEHYTLGASRTLADKRRVNVSLMYAPSSSVRGANAFDSTQSIKLEMHQFEFEIGFSW